MKEQLISYLSGLGYQCEVENGVVMILVDLADSNSFKEMQKVIHNFGYNQSWGIKQTRST
ncbi:MAG: hypothetical protein PHX08_08135 [Lachnospiraceae bacterium]|nr:hypothetical protein [Lachnospiraceae bacterium]